MHAILLQQGRVSLDSNHLPPQPHAGEVPIRVVMAGICETDLQLARGYMGFEGIPGHEFVGVAQHGKFAGQRVVGEINCSCHQCSFCRSGASNHCPNRTVLGILGRNGAFAEVVSLPERNLHPVPDSVPDWAAVFVEPVAAAFRIAEQIPLNRGCRTIVLGDGRLGNLCAQVLRTQGARVTVVGKHPNKLKLLENLGFEATVLEQVDGCERADLVVDCTGSSSGLESALKLVRPRGTVVLKTTVAGRHQLSLAPLVIDEVNLVGSRCGPFAPAIAAIARGDLVLAPLVEKTVPLEEVPAALEQAATTSVLKILIDVAGRPAASNAS